MRFSPQGGVGVISAFNEDYLKINFRFHCEFQLNQKPQKPFWFTPAQFSGDVIISRDSSHVREFKMEVPNENKFNVDLEWFLDDNDTADDVTAADDVTLDEANMEVDIGYLPKMKIFQKDPSSPRMLRDFDGSLIDRKDLWDVNKDVELQFEEIIWKEQLADDVVMTSLDQMMNPFKQVKYLKLEEAVMTSRRLSKPLHHLTLWGALDDQSC